MTTKEQALGTVLYFYSSGCVGLAIGIFIGLALTLPGCVRHHHQPPVEQTP